MMNITNIISTKSYYRFVEFVSKLNGNGLNHERFKLIALDLIEAQTKDEKSAKRVSDAYLYILTNIKQSFSSSIIANTYYLLTETLLAEPIIDKILNNYYIHSNEDTYLRVMYMQKEILKHNVDNKVILSFLISNFIMLKSGRNCLIPYPYSHQQYKANININDNQTWLELISGMEEKPSLHSDIQITKEEIINRIQPSLSFMKEKYHISYLGLYGGIVKGITTVSSDIDFLVLFEENLLGFQRGQNINNLKEFIKDVIKYEVDIIDFTHALKKLDISEMNNLITLIK